MADPRDELTPDYRPLLPEDEDQGDPFLFAPPPEAGARFRYYVYATGEQPAAGIFPTYGANDLTTWERIGFAFPASLPLAHWAPCVAYLPGLARPYVMLYSRAIGLDEEAHVGHVIRRADATAPEGPFADSGEALTTGYDFAIDPDVYRRPDGTLMLAFAVDFVEDEPYGTGIVEAPVAEDLTAIHGEPRLLARPSRDWHVFDAARVMPWKTIPGVDWARQTVRWHTVEAPVGGLRSPAGAPVYLYSGGCFFGFYAVGALRETADGLEDVTDGERNFVVRPEPERGFHGPGHCSYLRLDGGEEVLMLHARFGSPEAPRQMCLARLRWSADGLPHAAPYGATRTED